MQPLPDILQGCFVFPIVAGTKDPATKHGWHDASKDPAQIAEWKRLLPDCNWGVACGLSGLFVFDIDPAGLDWWAKLLERDAAIKAAVDAAFQVRTPKGGLHVYFRGSGPSTASRIADGIDTRGGIPRDGRIISGGYVVLPGSKTVAGPGRVAGSYVALPGGNLEILPDCLRDIIPERRKTDTLGLTKNPDHDQPRNVAWAVDLLKGYVKSGRVSIEGRGGNNLAFQVAASILDKAISPAMCFDLLWEHWNPHCSPVWDDWELETIVRNAANHGEDTQSGAKGFQANADAFAAFEGKEFETAQDIKEKERRIRFQPMWLKDARKDVKPAKWLIPGFLPDTGAGILYGLSGSYKTFLALDWALCLSHGVTGQWGAPPEKHQVLFLAGEASYALRQERVDAWCAAHDKDPDDSDLIIVPGVPSYSDLEGWTEIRDGLLAMKASPSLIVIDTLTRMATGLDENSNNDAKLLVKHCEEMADHYGAFVLAIGHTGKDQAKGLRGAQAFIDNSDVVLQINKRNDGNVALKVKKLKDVDIPSEPFYFKITDHASSIFLERTEEALGDDRKGKSSRFPWASVEEVVRVLQSMGGEASTGIFLQEIAGQNGIDGDLVRRELDKNKDLKFLRPDNKIWKIPVMEYDL